LKKPITYSIDEELIDQINKVAKEKDRSSSWVVNDYIDKGLKREQPPKKLVKRA
jgi:predicted transcriptional regulator